MIQKLGIQTRFLTFSLWKLQVSENERTSNDIPLAAWFSSIFLQVNRNNYQEYSLELKADSNRIEYVWICLWKMWFFKALVVFPKWYLLPWLFLSSIFLISLDCTKFITKLFLVKIAWYVKKWLYYQTSTQLFYKKFLLKIH